MQSSGELWAAELASESLHRCVRRKSGSGACGTGISVLRRFFFSSRRRHTRFDCDWSSDVCSSDLAQIHSHAHAHGDYVHTHPHGHSPEAHTHTPEQTTLAWLDRRLANLAAYQLIRPDRKSVV